MKHSVSHTHKQYMYRNNCVVCAVTHIHTRPGCSELDGCGESERLTSALNAVSLVSEHVTTTADVFLPSLTHAHTHSDVSVTHIHALTSALCIVAPDAELLQ